jgi:hypothetical protein
MRIAPFVIWASLASTASARPSTAAIGDYLGLFVEATVGQYQMLCSAREPATAALWKTDVRRWREANAKSLQELRAVAKQLELSARARALDPSSKELLEERETRLTAYTSFQMLAATQPAVELATSNDRQSSERCKSWHDAIAPNGPLETGLPQAILGAKRLLQAEAERRN